MCVCVCACVHVCMCVCVRVLMLFSPGCRYLRYRYCCGEDILSTSEDKD